MDIRKRRKGPMKFKKLKIERGYCLAMKLNKITETLK